MEWNIMNRVYGSGRCVLALVPGGSGTESLGPGVLRHLERKEEPPELQPNKNTRNVAL